MSNKQAKILITDLDGTLIPIDSDPAQCNALSDLKKLIEENKTPLVYATGRHFQSVHNAIKRFSLPQPSFTIADVGTSIYKSNGGQFSLIEEYSSYLQSIVCDLNTNKLWQEIRDIEHIRLQEKDKQGKFKLSFYVDAQFISDAVDIIADKLSDIGAPYEIVDSIDPFNGVGLIDLLPSGASKSAAIRWLSDYKQWPHQNIIYAGDSRNDLAAMNAGFNTIVVNNACNTLRNDVVEHHRQQGWVGRLYLANEPATCGVLEGCQKFDLFG